MPAAQPDVNAGDAPAPRGLRRVVGLLLLNLALSVVLTIAVLIDRHGVVNYQLDHRHIADPATRATLRNSYTISIYTRLAGNVLASVVYMFIVRALLRGRRWAYRRVIWLGAAGILGLLAIQATPYPTWMRIEQLAQALVLASLLYCVLRPEVRQHFAADLPGRTRKSRRAAR